MNKSSLVLKSLVIVGLLGSAVYAMSQQLVDYSKQITKIVSLGKPHFTKPTAVGNVDLSTGSVNYQNMRTVFGSQEANKSGKMSYTGLMGRLEALRVAQKPEIAEFTAILDKMFNYIVTADINKDGPSETFRQFFVEAAKAVKTSSYSVSKLPFEANRLLLEMYDTVKDNSLISKQAGNLNPILDNVIKGAILLNPKAK